MREAASAFRGDPEEEEALLRLSAKLIDHRYGLLDVSVASYNYLVQVELPRMVNELRPITWLERKPDSTLSIVMKIRFNRIDRPQLTDNQILLPLQAQQLTKSYNGRILIDVEITIKSTGPAGQPFENQADVRGLCIGEIPVLVGSCLCHRPLPERPSAAAPPTDAASADSIAAYFIVHGQNKVIVSQERLINNHPLVSASNLQSKQVQYTCEVRSAPATNTNRSPVIFALRVTVASVPALLPAAPVLADPLIVTLTYFRHEVPVILLFYAFGVFDLDAVCAKVQKTSRWADLPTLRRLLYATSQHTAAVRNRGEALSVLSGFMAQHHHPGNAAAAAAHPSPSSAAEELLTANVLPHLTTTDAKLEYLAYLIGVLLNHLFLPAARNSHQFDKDHMGNKRLDGCGTLLSRSDVPKPPSFGCGRPPLTGPELHLPHAGVRGARTRQGNGLSLAHGHRRPRASSQSGPRRGHHPKGRGGLLCQPLHHQDHPVRHVDRVCVRRSDNHNKKE